MAKRSEGKATLPGAKQVFRRFEEGGMAEDVVGTAEEELDGEPLLVTAMRDGEILHTETPGSDAGADHAQHRIPPGCAAKPG